MGENSYKLQKGNSILVQTSEYQGLATVTDFSQGSLRIKLLETPTGTPLEIGQKARVKAWDEKGVYFYSCEITGLLGDGPLEMDLSPSGEPVAIQRRGSFRIQANLPISFKVTEAAYAGLQSGKIYDLKTQNIGAGGLSFDTSLPLKEMDQLALELHFPAQELGVEGTVVTSERVERKGRFVNAIGVEFFDLSPETRRALMDRLMDAEGMKDSPAIH